MKAKAGSLQSLINAKPRPVTLEPHAAATARPDFIRHEHGQLALFESPEPGRDLLDWADAYANLVEETFARHGAVLFRGFALRDEETFGRFARNFAAGELMEYSEPSTPRTRVAGKLYTSTEYPPDQVIPPHNEHSYSSNWPMKIWFYCAAPAARGGETPLADGRGVFSLISPEVRELFTRKGVMYVRNFDGGWDLKWQQVFQTEDPREVEAHCRRAGIEYEWKEDGGLRTRQVCQAVFTHPRTKETVWFNQAHLFHVSNLEPAVREYLLEQYDEADLPRNAYFGDGSPIGEDALDEIRSAYGRAQFSFPWQARDVLMLDNVLYAHGRNPFEGARRVLVAMAEPFDARATRAGAGHKEVGETRQRTASRFVERFESEQSAELLRYKLAAAYRMMVTEGLDEGGISGHLTLRVPGEPDCFWVNPFGLLAEEVTPANLIKVDRTGRVLEGEHPVNVAGFCIHAAIHEARPDVDCVVHTHSPWGTLFSALGLPVEPIDQNCCMFFENHVLYDNYNGPVNDPEDASQLARALGRKDVAVLSNHGSLTCGESVESAVMLMVSLERAYRLNILAQRAGALKLIPPDVARQTREWIANPIGLAVEFDALLRKVERRYPEFARYKPAV